jgi:hypothetical protein
VPSSSGAEEDDQARLARAYNNSIYLFVGMPYLLLGAVGLLLYRGLRQRDVAPRPAAAHPAGPPEGLPCPTPSTDGTSSPGP